MRPRSNYTHKKGVKMAGKQLSGFEISKGEPLTISDEACARDLKRVISMIDSTSKTGVGATAAAVDGPIGGANRAVAATRGSTRFRCCRRRRTTPHNTDAKAPPTREVGHRKLAPLRAHKWKRSEPQE